MVIPMFIGDYIEKSLEELIKIRQELLEEMKAYEDAYILKMSNNEISDDDILVCPSPETIYSVNNDNLMMLTRLIEDKLHLENLEELTQIERKNIIFKYKYFSSNNFLCYDSTGFEIIITDENINNLRFYKMSFDDEILFKQVYTIDRKYIKKIKNIINANRKIFKINESLSNGSCDGSGNAFYFSNLKESINITAWNIQCSRGYKGLNENAKQEAYVLKVFDKICKILKTSNYELTLSKFRIIKNDIPKLSNKYYYLTVVYEDASYDKEYNYISDDYSITIGDRVLVERRNELVIAEVIDAKFYKKNEVPFPVEKTKHIIQMVDEDFELDSPKL